MYYIEQIRHQDWQTIREWRNAQMDILRQNHIISVEEQEAYLKTYYKECASYKPPQILYSFLYAARNEDYPTLIGYGGLVHINWFNKSAEISYLVSPDRKADLLQYAREWLTFLQNLRDYTAKLGLKKWKSVTKLSTGDPTRILHIGVIRVLFRGVTNKVENDTLVQEWEI